MVAANLEPRRVWTMVLLAVVLNSRMYDEQTAKEV